MKKIVLVLGVMVLLMGTGGSVQRRTNMVDLVLVDWQTIINAESYGLKYIDNTNAMILVMSLPDELGGLKSKGIINNYEKSSHGLGYSKKYILDDKDMYADVYVYHMRMDDLVDGIESDRLEDIYYRTIDEIHSMEGRLYSGITKIELKDVMIDGLAFKKYAVKALRLGENSKDIVSEMLVTIYNGVILKVRVSYATDEVANGDEIVGKFMADLAGHLGGKSGN